MIPSELRRLIADALRSSELARVFTLVALGTALSSFAITRLSGPWTLHAMIAGLCVVGGGILVARRHELSVLRFAPTTLAAFLAWAVVSVAWAFEEGDTLRSWLSLLAYGFLAVVVAHVRDTLQTVRALGDVLRALLAVSLGIEILSGILLDMPFPFLGVAGDIAFGGPIQGVFGTRNYLGFVTVVALITFLVEWRTQSISLGRSVASIALAGLLMVLSTSPTAVVVALTVGVAMLALSVVRRVQPRIRRDVQLGLGVTMVVGGLAAFLLRSRIIDIVGAATDFSNRSILWRQVMEWIPRRWLQGWGWHGSWANEPFPFNTINFRVGVHHTSALNAYLDVTVQLGVVGLLLFVGMCAVGFVRAWLTASERRSTVYAWTPLMLVALLTESMFESFTLGGAGWMLLVLCVVRAGQTRSWRTRIDEASPGPDLPEALPHER